MNPFLVATGTAALFSKRFRGALRKGVVYGLAGVIEIGDAAVGVARGTTSTAEKAASKAGETVSDAAQGTAHGVEKVASTTGSVVSAAVHGAEKAAGSASEMVGGLIEEARGLREKGAEPPAPKAAGEAQAPKRRGRSTREQQ